MAAAVVPGEEGTEAAGGGEIGGGGARRQSAAAWRGGVSGSSPERRSDACTLASATRPKLVVVAADIATRNASSSCAAVNGAVAVALATMASVATPSRVREVQRSAQGGVLKAPVVVRSVLVLALALALALGVAKVAVAVVVAVAAVAAVLRARAHRRGLARWAIC